MTVHGCTRAGGVYDGARLAREAQPLEAFGAFGGLDDPSNGQPVASVAPIGGEGAAMELLDPVSFAQQSATPLPPLSNVSRLQLQGLGVFYDAAGSSRFVLYRTPDYEYGIVSM